MLKLSREKKLMITVKVIYLKFNLIKKNKNAHISPDDFRKALINHTKNTYPLLHNHDNDNFNYKYPLVQFKEINESFYIIGLNEGSDILLDIVENDSLIFSNKDFEIEEKPKIKLMTKKINTINTPIMYRISKWFALNEENYEKFTKEQSLINKITFLQSILNANILSFAKGINYTIKQPLNTIIHDIHKLSYLKFKNIDVLTFDLSFYSNIILPDLIGLGKASSKGFGTIQIISKHQKKKNAPLIQSGINE